MFADHVELVVSSGKGGPGCVAFRREKFVVNGGPSGGDGGRGGDVWFKCDNNSHTLAKFKGLKHLKAENGKPGMGSNMTGKSGEDLIISVPPGTQIIDKESGEVLFDMVRDGQKELFLRGGKGGLGNVHFKSSTNQQPRYAQPGEEGETREIKLDLKLIADVGLVGFPNVGKSTLISTISNAKPEIADYEFTTLTPKLAQVQVGDFDAFVMADIPGIIEGASDGRGLGLQFLRHIERTKSLLFMIDMANYRSLEQQYTTLRHELAQFSPTLAKSAFAIALTRVDALDPSEVAQKVASFITTLGLVPSFDSLFGFDTAMGLFEQGDLADERTPLDPSKPYFIAPISSVMHTNIQALKFALFKLVERAR